MSGETATNHTPKGCASKPFVLREGAQSREGRGSIEGKQAQDAAACLQWHPSPHEHPPEQQPSPPAQHLAVAQPQPSQEHAAPHLAQQHAHSLALAAPQSHLGTQPHDDMVVFFFVCGWRWERRSEGMKRRPCVRSHHFACSVARGKGVGITRNRSAGPKCRKSELRLPACRPSPLVHPPLLSPGHSKMAWPMLPVSARPQCRPRRACKRRPRVRTVALPPLQRSRRGHCARPPPPPPPPNWRIELRAALEGGCGRGGRAGREERPHKMPLSGRQAPNKKRRHANSPATRACRPAKRGSERPRGGRLSPFYVGETTGTTHLES